jgi:hypothetical protein
MKPCSIGVFSLQVNSFTFAGQAEAREEEEKKKDCLEPLEK